MINSLSKITPPLLPQTLDRPRLLAILEKNKHKKVILIIGQAAQGKTILAASYAKASKIPTAWINLGPEDSDPFNFFPAVIRSFQQVLKDVDFSPLLPYFSGTMGQRLEVPLFTEWAHSFFERVISPVQFIVDGLNLLSADAPAFLFLQVFIEQMPPHVRLILLSREMPPPCIDFQRLKMSQEALMLGNEDLAFTPEEIRDFFRKIKKMNLDADRLIKISLATEGWVGGLILLSESLRLSKEDFRKDKIFQDLPDEFKEEAFQYLAKEIFSKQPESVQKFLIKSSIIDLVEPSFLKELVGMENANEILLDLVKRNLFVHSVFDEKKNLAFRYHQLLRDFLRAKFETELGENERHVLLMKAGQLSEQRGQLQSAVKYYLEAKAHPQVISIIERLGVDLLKRGRKEDLSQWIAALPEDQVQKNPWLLFYLSMTRRFVSLKANILDLRKAFAIFKRKGDLQGRILSLAFLIENLIYSGHYTVPVGSLIKEGERILASLRTELLPYERAVLWAQIGLGNIRAEGNIRNGISACETAYLIARQLKDINLQISTLVFMVLGFAALGEFESGEEANTKIEKIIEKGSYPEMRASHLLASSLLLTSKGNFKEAEAHIHRLESTIEKYGIVYMHPMALSLKGFSHIHLQKFGEAEKIGEQLRNMADALGNRFLKGMSLELIGQCHYHLESYRMAQKSLAEAIEVFSSKSARSEYHLHWAKQMMGLVCCHLKEFHRAEKELKESLAYFKKVSNYLLIAGNHFGLAILSHLQGRKDEASRHLQAGVRVVEEKRYEHLLVLSPTDLTRVCMLALDLQPPGTLECAERLLCTRVPSIAAEKLKDLFDHPDSKVKERVWEIRRKIHRSRAPLLRIETLGGFRVFRGDALIEEKEWDRNQPKQLLRAIVSHRNHNIPRDFLMEYIWPEAEAEAGEKKFKTTLQRLRKSLEPAIDQDFNSSYVHLHDNLISLDPELCRVDTDLFLSNLKAGEERERGKDLKGALSLYADAVEIYKGDFLPDDQYNQWVDAKREELKGKYIDLLIRMAKLYEKQGASAKAIACHKKAILADPILEESYRGLMTLYANMGTHNEALRVYENCKKALQEGLDSTPDPMTTALHKKILEKIHSV